jgi:dienelactone hydrolase
MKQSQPVTVRYTELQDSPSQKDSNKKMNAITSALSTSLIPAIAAAVTGLLVGCSGAPTIEQRAIESGMQGIRAGHSNAQVAALVRPGRGELLRVYIEGDGRAYITASQPSGDPTPITNTLIRMAAADSANTAYLARPCQFFKHSGCKLSSWTTGRFSRANVQAMNSALDDLKSRAGAKRLELVGYSGGAAIALLLAAQREDVAQVQTIAGTLDHVAWTELKRLRPLDGSLNPSDYGRQLGSIPQRHFVGTADQVVPPSVAASYIRKAKPACVELVTTSASHAQGFEGAWYELKDKPIRCSGG